MADITLLYLVKQVELAIRVRLDDTVAPHGLTSLQYTALTVLERRPGLTSAELARNSFVRAQTMAEMVLELERRELIARAPAPGDRRQFRIELTDAGRIVLDALRKPVADLERTMIATLSEGDVVALRSSLRAARVALGGDHPH